MRNLFLILFTFLTFHSYAVYDFNHNCRTAFDEILKLRFDVGKDLLDYEKKLNPANDIPYLLENYIDCLTIIIGEEKSQFEKLKDNKNSRLVRLEKGDKSSPYYRYCLAELHLQWAFSRIKFRDYMTAAIELNKAYRLLEKNKADFPDFIPNLKSIGLLHVLIGAVPDEYKWVTNILQLDGDLKDGTAELEKVLYTSTQNPNYGYLKTESVFLLTFIYINFGNDKAKLNKISNIIQSDYDSNIAMYSPLICYCKAKIALSYGNNDKAIDILLSRPKFKDSFSFNYLDYMTALAKLNRFDADADKYFINYINSYKGLNYIKSAYQKLAWYYLIKGDQKKYNEYILLVKTKGSKLVDEDIQAEKEAESGIIPNAYLLKARLLCDGGYYDKAISVILRKNATEVYTNQKDYLEFTYRLGRIYDNWGKLQQAIPYYELTIKNGTDSKYYFAANSCLHLGIIYEGQSNFTKAKYYFNKCLAMNNNEYKNSIRQKAKAGLKRVSVH